jgi:hypothetical protein
MANETEMANIIGQTDVISAGIAKALVDTAIYPALVYQEPVPDNTPVKLFRQEGLLIAEAVNESAVLTISSNDELTQSSVSATAGKSAVISRITAEAKRFRNLTPGKIAQLQGEAIARLLDDNLLTLHSSFTHGITCTSTATPGDIFSAVYQIDSSAAGTNGRTRGVLSHKQKLDLQQWLVNTGAVAWSAPQNQSFLSGMVAPNGYVGTIGSTDFFATNGLPTTGGDDVGLIFNPENALAAMYDAGVETMAVPVVGGGFYVELGSYTFSKAVVWVNFGGCKFRSDS